MRNSIYLFVCLLVANLQPTTILAQALPMHTITQEGCECKCQGLGWSEDQFTPNARACNNGTKCYKKNGTETGETKNCQSVTRPVSHSTNISGGLRLADILVFGILLALGFIAYQSRRFVLAASS